MEINISGMLFLFSLNSLKFFSLHLVWQKHQSTTIKTNAHNIYKTCNGNFIQKKNSQMSTKDKVFMGEKQPLIVENTF